MTRDCTQIQKEIVEVGGSVENLERGLRGHIRTCDSCRRIAELETSLTAILAEASPPADPELQERITTGVARLRRRRQLWSVLPVAASLMVALLGVVALGGVPAGGLAANLAVGSGAGWMELVSSLGQLATVATVTVEALSRAVTPAFGLLAAGVMLSGIFGLGQLSRRWKLQPQWRAGS